MTAIYRVGERVDGLYDENTDDMWYPGRVRCVHLSDATFEVLYDDGEVEMNVRPEFLRQHVAGTICVGTRVLCRYDGGEEFYPGQVSDVQEDGRYTIAYDDGEVEEDVPLENIMEPKEVDEVKDEAEADEPAEGEEKLSNNVMDDQPEHQQQEEQYKMEELAGGIQENEESVHGDNKSDESANDPEENIRPPIPEPSKYDESPDPSDQNEDRPDATPAGLSTERAYIMESLQLLEKRLGDAASTKAVLSTLVKQMRAYPQITADLVHERGGERLIIDALKFHQSHAVIQCYGCVLLRRLCFLCVKSTHYLLRNGIVELVIQAMNAFAEDAILQASACGALAVFTRVHAGLNILIEFQVAQLVLSTLIYHKTYSVHTRQVHYYACEVLLELCELDDLQTLNLLCGEQEEDFTGDMSPISLLLFLLRQGLSLDDKKACCAVGSLLMCLAASGRRAAALILSLNGLAELSTVMARYPTEPSIQKYSAAASKQIALCSVRQSPTKRIKDTATEILREAESIESTPREPPTKKSTSRRSTNTGKRKNNPSTGYGATSHPRGSAYSSSTPYRSTQGFSKLASPYEQSNFGFGGDMNSYNYPVSAPQQPSSLVILDGGIGMDSGFGSTNMRKQLSKEDRQSELLHAYGIQEMDIPNGRPYGTKRAQLRAHLVSAESTWATPQQRIPSTIKPYSSRSGHLDHGSEYSHRDFMPSRQNTWGFGADEHQNSAYETEPRHPRGGKRKKKTPGVRTAFQVKLENENQLRVSRETRSPPSPQRLGAATKRAAKARHKRVAATGHSSLAGKSSNALSESLNDYATQLFQDNASRGGANIPTRSKLTPREKEEIRERERLSFAEKLHKMIDKAKSTLASSNAMDTATLPPKSSKAARKTPTEKRPLSERTRMLASTSKQVEKEVLSPREAAETRPAKPTSRTTRRSEPSSVPVVPRPRPTVARSVVTPKVTTDPRPRGSKATKAAPTKTVEKTQVEKPKEAAVASTPTEAAPIVNTLEVEDTHPVNTFAQPAEEVAIAEETEPTVPVEPVVSSSDTAGEMKIDVVSSNAASESQVKPTPTENQDDRLPSDEGGIEELPGHDSGVEATVVVVETETVNTSASPPQAMEADVVPEPTVDAPELSEETVDEQQSPLEEPSAASEPTVDLPSGGSAAVDAMYGDAFSEFDDNGGEDEDMTAEAGADPDDTHTPATEISDPTDIPLQESKSGEALYDDYDEFDEDESPQTEDAEVEDTPVAEAENEFSGVTTSRTETESDPIADVPEGEVETEAPAMAAEDVASSVTEGENGDESSLHGTNADENGGDIAAKSEESESQAGQEEPLSEVTDNGNASEEAPSDSDPVVGSIEEQEPVNLGTDSVTEPSDENAAESGPHADPVDDPDKIPADILVRDEGNGEEVVERGAEPDTDVSPSASVAELTEAEGAVENVELSAQLEGETSVPNLPGGVVVPVDSTTEEAITNPVQLSQNEEDRIDTTAQQDEPQISDESATSREQDEEAKKLTADSSVASVQSAAYDEDNFDDEETHEETEPSDGIDASVVVTAVEETVAVVEPQQEDPIATITTDKEDESKTLVANSSEHSVQSAGYDDDGFEDGAQEDPQADHSEDKAPEQEPSGDETTDSIAVDKPVEPAVEDERIVPEHDGDDRPEKQTVENESPTAATETHGDGEFDNAEVSKVTTPDPVLEMVDAPSELKQPDSTPTPESEVVVDPSIVTGNETPDSTTQEETGENTQAPVDVDVEKDENDGQVDNTTESAIESDSVPAAAPGTDDSTPASIDPSATTDTLEDEASETNLPTEDGPAQEEAEAVATSTQPDSYDDDNFADEEEAAPSVATEEPGLVENKAADKALGDEELEIQPSKQPSEDIVAIDKRANAAEEAPPEADLDPKPDEDAVNSNVVRDKPDDSASNLVPESKAGNPSEEVEDSIEAPTESEANVALVADEVGNSMSAVEESESELTATPEEQPGGQVAFMSPDDESPETENTVDTPQAENVPDPEVELDTQVELNDTATDTPDQSAAEETVDETSPESAQRSDDIISVADIPAEPSVDATQEATEYEDAEFDDAEEDAALPKDDTSENKPVQDEIGANEETTPENIVSDITKEEYADQPTDTPTTEAENNEPVAEKANEQPTNADVDDPTSANVNLEASNPAATAEETKTEADVDVDATPYEEDFPDETSPETQEDPAVETETISTEVDAADADSVPTATIGIDSSPDNEASAPDENVSELEQPSSDVVAVPDPPKDELYDDGFDDDIATPSIDPSNFATVIETSYTAGGDPDVDGDALAEAAQGEADPKVEEVDVADSIEVETSMQNEPVESESVNETVEPVLMGSEIVETAPVEVEVVNAAPMEPEAATVISESSESAAVELETVDSDTLQDEVVESDTVQPEAKELESGEDDVESGAVESENNKSLTADPAENPLTAETHVADQEPVEPAAVESAADTIASVPERQGESIIANPSTEDPATPEAGQEQLLPEPSEVPIPIKSNSDSLPTVEVPVQIQEDAPTESNDESSSATDEAKDDAPQEEKSSSEEVIVDPLQSDEPVEDATSSSVEAPPIDDPVEVASVEQLEPIQSEAEHTLEVDPLRFEDTPPADDYSGGAVDSADAVPQDNREVPATGGVVKDDAKVTKDPVEPTTEPTEVPNLTEAFVEPTNEVQPTAEDQASVEPDYPEDNATDEAQPTEASVESDYLSQEDREVASTSGVVKDHTAQMSENPVETTTEMPELPEEIDEPTHEAQPTVKDEASAEPDYEEDDAMADESPVVLQSESKATEGVKEVENTESLPQESTVQDGVNVPGAAEKLAVEMESPQLDQTVAVTASSERPKTEDQYDDDEGYNDFDEEENESPPTVDVPAPATAVITEPPATDDEYENDEYGEEEKPSESPRVDPKSHSNPRASAREEEIDEVADEPEEAEEDAYADDQDEYEEDEAPAPAPKSSSSSKPAPQAEVEASADEYEDDNEEEDYADDEIEDSSPPKPAPVVRAAKSDDEMEEELESEDDYASD
ncbi:hypothetical protein V7S43_002156 [Phytophthora oleae]|uniref:Tudor domain-containing protein n=1 Tax=Phytophthora oleae TaxID=2107226 RepID=A0ABD3G305_9STRA